MGKTWRREQTNWDDGYDFDVVCTPNSSKKLKFDRRRETAVTSRKDKEKFLDEVSRDNRFVGIDPRQT